MTRRNSRQDDQNEDDSDEKHRKVSVKLPSTPRPSENTTMFPSDLVKSGIETTDGNENFKNQSKEFKPPATATRVNTSKKSDKVTQNSDLYPESAGYPESGRFDEDLRHEPLSEPERRNGTTPPLCASKTKKISEDLNNLLLLKNQTKRLDNKISHPEMKMEGEENIKVKRHIPEDYGEEYTDDGHDSSPFYHESDDVNHWGHEEEYDDRNPATRERSAYSQKYRGYNFYDRDQHGYGPFMSYDNAPISLEPVSTYTTTHKSVKRLKPGMYRYEEEHKSRENLLEELRSIARREAIMLQESSERTGEMYFHPPVSPSKQPLKYLRDTYSKETEPGGEVWRKQKKVDREISEDVQTDGDSDFKSFNDFDQSIFKFNTDTKLFHCPWEGCDKAFPSLSRIKRHYIIHTDIKPFKCMNPGCNRRFSRKDNMLQHYRVHCPHANQPRSGF